MVRRSSSITGQLDWSQLGQISTDGDAADVGQVLARDRPGGDAHAGLARGSTATTTIVTLPVLLYVSVIGVSGAEFILDIRVVARLLIHVLDQQTNRRTGGPALEDTRKYAHRVVFAPLGGVP